MPNLDFYFVSGVRLQLAVDHKNFTSVVVRLSRIHQNRNTKQNCDSAYKQDL